MSTIGVVVTMSNAAAHLAETLRSVTAQSWDWRLVVVDDGSTDGSADLARSVLRGEARAQVIEQDGAGICAARNHGAFLVGASWMLFLDAGDVLAPKALVTLASKPMSAATVGRYCVIDADGQPGVEPFQSLGILSDGRGVLPSAALIDTTAFRRAGCWDEDDDLWPRLLDQGRVYRVPEVVVLHRQPVSAPARLAGSVVRRLRS